MARITIDGRTFEGNSLDIVGGKVTIDGKPVDGTLVGEVKLKIEGVLASLKTTHSVVVHGGVGGVDAGGSVQCGDVSGNVEAGGSVQCGRVGGKIKAGGSVISS